MSLARPKWQPLTLEEGLLLGAVVYFVGLKLFLWFSLFPFPDEAYYWTWGQHPALSYFDHPALPAWLQAISHALFGRSLFALRLPAMLAFLGTVFIFYRVARDIGGGRWRLVLLRSLVAYLGTVLFGVFLTLVFPDYLLVFLLFGSVYLFSRYLGAVADGGEGRLLQLFGAAALLGLAGLAKYNAVFIGLGVAGAVVTMPPLRRLLARPSIYLAGALALAIQAPILVWNLQHDFASFRFHLVDRHGDGGFSLNALLEYALINVLAFSPFLIVPLARFFLKRPADGFTRVAKTIAIWAFWLSTVTFFANSADAPVIWWWNIVAFVPALPFLGAVMGRLGTALQILWGALMATLAVAMVTVVVVPYLLGLNFALDTDTIAGWQKITASVSAARQREGADFVAANRYEPASQLGYALDDPWVVLLSPRRTAFDDWTDEAALRGKSAILVVDHTDMTEGWRAAFGTFRLLETFTVPRLGTPQTYDIYLAEDYRPGAL